MSTHDEAGYFDATADRGTLVRKDMITALEAFGIEVEASHHEVATGQHEIDFRYGDAHQDGRQRGDLQVRAQGHRPAARPVCHLYAQADPRHQRLGHARAPEPGRPRHRQERLCRRQRPVRPVQAGQALYRRPTGACARACRAILAPLVNSYKRLVPGYEAPVYISWARINRSALIRVPKPSSARRHAPGAALPRSELQPLPGLCGDAQVRPGRHQERPAAARADRGEPVRVRVGAHTACRPCPARCDEALDELEKDAVVQEALGPHIYERFVEAKTARVG